METLLIVIMQLWQVLTTTTPSEAARIAAEAKRAAEARTHEEHDRK